MSRTNSTLFDVIKQRLLPQILKRKDLHTWFVELIRKHEGEFRHYKEKTYLLFVYFRSSRAPILDDAARHTRPTVAAQFAVARSDQRNATRRIVAP